MQKIYLKFETLEECETIIATTEYDVNDRKTFFHWGELAKETGETLQDSDGNDYPEMTPVTGHHVDMYIEDDSELPSELTAYQVSTPDNPVHKLR